MPIPRSLLVPAALLASVLAGAGTATANCHHEANEVGFCLGPFPLPPGPINDLVQTLPHEAGVTSPFVLQALWNAPLSVPVPVYLAYANCGGHGGPCTAGDAKLAAERLGCMSGMACVNLG